MLTQKKEDTQMWNRMEKLPKCCYIYQVDCAPEMANVIMPAISAACVDPEYAKCSIICASDW